MTSKRSHSRKRPTETRRLRLPPDENRRRLIEALASSIEQNGYRRTSVADIVRIARTSRRTFYEHFEDRDACFLALFDAANEQMMQRIAARVRSDAPWSEQVDMAINAYLDDIAERPALFKSFARELSALGEAGDSRARAAVERIATLLITLVEYSRREHPDVIAHPLSFEMAVVIVAGLRELTVAALEEDADFTPLRATVSEIVKTILNAAVLSSESPSSRSPVTDTGHEHR